MPFWHSVSRCGGGGGGGGGEGGGGGVGGWPSLIKYRKPPQWALNTCATSIQ